MSGRGPWTLTNTGSDAELALLKAIGADVVVAAVATERARWANAVAWCDVPEKLFVVGASIVTSRAFSMQVGRCRNDDGCSRSRARALLCGAVFPTVTFFAGETSGRQHRRRQRNYRQIRRYTQYALVPLCSFDSRASRTTRAARSSGDRHGEPSLQRRERLRVGAATKRDRLVARRPAAQGRRRDLRLLRPESNLRRCVVLVVVVVVVVED